MSSMRRGWSASLRRCSTTAASRCIRSGEPRAAGEARAQHEERQRTPLLPIRIAIERRTPIEWRAEDVASVPFEGTEGGRADHRRRARRDRLDVLLHRVGAEGLLSRRSLTTPSSARRRASSSTTHRTCSPRSSRKARSRSAARTACGRRCRRRRHRARQRRHACRCSASRPTVARPSRTARSPTSSRRSRRD